MPPNKSTHRWPNFIFEHKMRIFHQEKQNLTLWPPSLTRWSVAEWQPDHHEQVCGPKNLVAEAALQGPCSSLVPPPPSLAGGNLALHPPLPPSLGVPSCSDQNSLALGQNRKKWIEPLQMGADKNTVMSLSFLSYRELQAQGNVLKWTFLYLIWILNFICF